MHYTYHDMFDYWSEMAGDSSVVLLESMCYDLKTFKIPKVFQRVASDCFRKRLLRYSDPGGFIALKTAITAYETLQNPVLKNKDHMVFVGNGTSEIFLYVVKAILKLPENISRKKFVLFKPGYSFFDNCITYAGGTCTFVRGERKNQFIPALESIEAALDNDVCAIVLINPHNPTGISYPKSYLSGIVRLARKKNIMIISDEVYAEMVRPPYTHYNILQINKSYDHVVRLFGPAKDRPGFSGIRIGYCIGDKRLEPFILETILAQSFATNIIAEYLFLYDIILRTYCLTRDKKMLLQDISESELLDYQKIIAGNYETVFDLQDYVCKRFDKVKNRIDYIKPHGCNMVFFSYKHKRKENFRFIDIGAGLYPGDFFYEPSSEENSWSRICLTMKKEKLDKGLKKLGV